MRHVQVRLGRNWKGPPAAPKILKQKLKSKQAIHNSLKTFVVGCLVNVLLFRTFFLNNAPEISEFLHIYFYTNFWKNISFDPLN